MRVYVAGKYQERNAVKLLQKILQLAGHQITFDWTAQEPSDDTVTRMTYAENDLYGVQSADFIVCLVTHNLPYRGMFVEIGAALALEKPVYLLGSGIDSCIFASHRLIHKIASMNDLPE